MLKSVLIVSAAGLGLILPAFASDREDDMGRIQKATKVFEEVMRAPDQGIPHDLLERNEMRGYHSRRGEGGLHFWRQLWQRTGDLSHRQWLERSDVPGRRRW